MFLFIAVIQEDPEFTDVIDNITVPAGRNVKLACSVKNLGSYKVSEFGMVNGDEGLLITITKI